VFTKDLLEPNNLAEKWGSEMNSEEAQAVQEIQNHGCRGYWRRWEAA